MRELTTIYPAGRFSDIRRSKFFCGQDDPTFLVRNSRERRRSLVIRFALFQEDEMAAVDLEGAL